MVAEHQQRRDLVTPEVVAKFFEVRPLDFWAQTSLITHLTNISSPCFLRLFHSHVLYLLNTTNFLPHFPLFAFLLSLILSIIGIYRKFDSNNSTRFITFSWISFNVFSYCPSVANFFPDSLQCTSMRRNFCCRQLLLLFVVFVVVPSQWCAFKVDVIINVLGMGSDHINTGVAHAQVIYRKIRNCYGSRKRKNCYGRGKGYEGKTKRNCYRRRKRRNITCRTMNLKSSESKETLTVPNIIFSDPHVIRQSYDRTQVQAPINIAFEWTCRTNL